MSELARVLRDTRKAQSISLDEAERVTKIRRRYLEAIEAGDFEALPDGPPSRGFIKNYARFLTLDEDQALMDFEAEVGVPVVYAREHIPPPPNHTRQRKQSSYTQLQAPRLSYKGRLPAPKAHAANDQDEPEDRDLSRIGSGLSTSTYGNAISGDYNLGFDEDDDGNDRDNRDDRIAIRRDARGRRDVILSNKGKVKASKSSFRLTGGAVKNNGFSLTDGVPEISTVLPAKNKRAGYSAKPSLSFGMPKLNLNLPAGVLKGLAGLVGFVGVLALIYFLVLPAVRTLGIGSAQVATPTTKTGQPRIAVTLISPQTRSQSQTGAVVPSSQTQPNAAVPANPDGVQLALDAREHAWIRVKVDGNVVFEGMPAIGPTVPWSAKNKISVETGNAGAFDVIVNGVRVGALGERNTAARRFWDLSGQMKEGE